MQKKTAEPMTANDFVNVKDIRGNILYTRDGLMFGYIKISPYNLDLLSYEDKQLLAHRLAVSFEDDRKDFVYCSYPREIDLDSYKDFLKERRRQEMTSIGRKRILEEMLQASNEISNSGENFEHQHYIKIWDDYRTEVRNCEYDFLERLQSFRDRYNNAGIQAEILGEKEIIKLCNLFANPRQAAYDVDSEKDIQERVTFVS